MINGFKKPFDNDLNMYVVVVGVHPEDAELCCGGSIVAFLARKMDVLVVCITKEPAGIPAGCDPKNRVIVGTGSSIGQSTPLIRAKWRFESFPVYFKEIVK